MTQIWLTFHQGSVGAMQRDRIYSWLASATNVMPQSWIGKVIGPQFVLSLGKVNELRIAVIILEFRYLLYDLL